MMGTILRVNLTTGAMKTESAEPYRDWVGGIGVAERILYDEVKPWMTAYDPGNRFILATGALSGMLCPGAGRIAAVTKSPMTTGIASGNAGGNFGASMRYAGFSYIVFEGRSRTPVYLFIKGGKAELRSADAITGAPVKDAVDYFEREHGASISTICIGPAGENLVRYACATVDRHRVIGKCGFGAVMGSKNLKAVVADFSLGSVKPANGAALLKKVREIYRRVEENPAYRGLMQYGTLCGIPRKYEIGGFSYRHGQDLNIPKQMAETYEPAAICVNRVYQSACGGCMIGCQNHHRIQNGPNAGYIMGGTPFNSVLNFGTKLDISDYDFCVQATWLCNNYGMDMDVVAELLGWVMECYEKGILTAQALDGLTPNFGNKQAALKLIEKMAYRDGVGDLLAEGVARASTVIANGSDYYGLHAKGNDLYEVFRPLIGYGLGAAVSTRGGSHVLGAPVCETGIYTDHEKEAAYRKFGVRTFDDPLAYDGKPEIVTYYESITRACSSMGLCLMISDWQHISMLDHQDLADLLLYASGMTLSGDELRRKMLALLSLEKVFNYSHAGFTRADDMPKERLFREAAVSGPSAGAILDRKKWDAMLDQYYALHHWDIQTGLPTEQSLRELGLEDLIADLHRPARAPGRAFLP